MSFHFCTHSWEVRHLEDGTAVTLRNRDLGAEALDVLVDDLPVVVEESGLPNLYLDFTDIGLISERSATEIVQLQGQLQDRGGRLALINVRPSVHATLSKQETLDIQPVEALA